MAARLNGGGGLKQEKLWRDALMRAVKRKLEGGSSTFLEVIADRVVSLASRGDMVAVKEIGDRLDGKPAQSLFDDLPEGTGRLVLVWERAEESPSPIVLETNSSPSIIEHKDSPSESLTEELGKP